MKSHHFLSLLKEAASDWIDDNAPRLSAALAYYAVFSLAPLLVITVAVAGLAFGQEAARGCGKLKSAPVRSFSKEGAVASA